MGEIFIAHEIIVDFSHSLAHEDAFQDETCIAGLTLDLLQVSPLVLLNKREKEERGSKELLVCL